MLFNGSQIEQLCDAMGDAFNENSLEQTVLFRLNKVLFKIVPRGDFPTVVRKLIVLAEEEGWIRLLVQVVASVRGKNDKVATFCNTHAPWAFNPPTPETLVGQVKTALETVNEKKTEPAVREVINRFQTDLRSARDGTAALNKYKQLHDLLHTLQVMFPQQLAGAATEARNGSLNAPVKLYAFQLKNNALKAKTIANELPTRTLELGWAASLEQVATLVAQGQSDKPASLDAALVLLESVLSEAPRINARLTEVAAGLKLGGLVSALEEIRDQLIGTPAEGEIKSALEGLKVLRPRLDGLMQEHYEWQVLDKSFRVAEVLPGCTLANRFPGWELTHTRLKALFTLCPEELWVVMLQEQIQEMEQAGKAGDPGRFERAFDTFRVVARDHFMDVDTELLNRSAELAQVAPALNTLV
ncbi:MAG: effector-associated domain EAD1-containing protein [Planctomycetia bacterium]|nr:effector-associated domain EAD1-containing protein [Planctomycetia bacterium]